MKRIMCIASLALALFLFIGISAFSADAASTSLKTGVGRISASALRLRAAPSTASATLAYGGHNEIVVVEEKVGAWYKVNYNLQTGYMHSDYLKVTSSYNAELGYGKVLGSSVNVRSNPGSGYQSIGHLVLNDKAYILGLRDGWYRIRFGSTTGYIRSDYVALTEVPYENAASSREPQYYTGGQAITPDDPGQSIIDSARRYLGVPYVWGGTTAKGFDCSGLVQVVFAENGISLPRTSSQQYSVGTWVTKANLKKGDLLFFNTSGSGVSHVGIYAGNGQFIHCSSSKGVTVTELSNSYWAQRYLGAKRVL